MRGETEAGNVSRGARRFATTQLAWAANLEAAAVMSAVEEVMAAPAAPPRTGADDVERGQQVEQADDVQRGQQVEQADDVQRGQLGVGDADDVARDQQEMGDDRCRRRAEASRQLRKRQRQRAEARAMQQTQPRQQLPSHQPRQQQQRPRQQPQSNQQRQQQQQLRTGRRSAVGSQWRRSAGRGAGGDHALSEAD